MAPTAAPLTASAARLSYLGISVTYRRTFVASARACNDGAFHRSDFTGHGFEGYYEPGPTEGPLKDASNIGVPRITPRSLKGHLDQFVVGQERAKKVLSVAVYNHYQRVQELERQDEEMEEMMAQQARRERAREVTHPLEGEFPGQQRTVTSWDPNGTQKPADQPLPLGSSPIIDASPLSIEKSNVMLLGPSGVGKTLMAKTLARVLEVPFSMSDCTPLTQAGYIGEDVDVIVSRLLVAANYDVAKAERGIVCLDEIDKIATAKVNHGKDVSGQGVQQALLKIIEGTTVQVQAKSERSSGGGLGRSNRSGGGEAGNSPSGNSAGAPGKAETFNVRTDNILFICTGAFIGLHQMIMDRISKGSIGFNANVRASPISSDDPNNPLLTGQEDLFRKHLPFYSPVSSSSTSSSRSQRHTSHPVSSEDEHIYNSLDLATPADLQRYGLIPELVGRIPVTCALSPLSVAKLVQVLTEPRNSLLKQYTQLFALSSIELRLTTPALHSIAAQAAAIGTGARGLRAVMEGVLADAMYETPGSGVRFVAVTEAVAKREKGCVYFTRDEGKAGFRALIAREEEEWEERRRQQERDRDAGAGGEEGEVERRAAANREGGAATSFEEYRQKVGAAGFG